METLLQAILFNVMIRVIECGIMVGFIWFLMGGFLFKFIKVKASRGVAKLVKIREVDHDAFAIGEITEGFLVFKYQKETRRVVLPSGKNYFYRAMGITWIDYDSEKNAFGLHDYTTVTGHDAIKTQNFLKRIIMMSQTKQDLSMAILLVVIIVGLAVIGSIVLNVQNANHITALQLSIENLKASLNVTIAPPPKI